MEEDNNKSIFEILDFTPNPVNRTACGDNGLMFDCPKIAKEDSRVLEIASKLCKDRDSHEEKPSINIHEAAILAGHFGIPNDAKKREEWEKMTFSEKVALVMNSLTESGVQSFTEIL